LVNDVIAKYNVAVTELTKEAQSRQWEALMDAQSRSGSPALDEGTDL
jgi:hypothetical protein